MEERELDAIKLGENLKRARERSGKSQQQVADLLALPRTAVTNLEAGNRAVSTLELSKLAALYGQPIAHFFGQPKSNMEDLSAVVLPRALPAIMASDEMRRAIEKIIDLYTEGAQLRELLGNSIDSAVPNYAMRAATVGESLRQAELVAHEERRRLGLGVAPIGNVAGLIASQGIWTAATELPEDLSGLFINHNSIGFAVVVNSAHHAVRRRFSYAHEYAHALFDRDDGIRKTERANASDLVEKRANSFAASFLMPTDGILEQLRLMDKGNPSRQSQILFDVAGNLPQEAEIRPPAGSQAITYQDVTMLAQHFGVSYEAMVWRLKSIGKISASETDFLISKKGVGRDYGQALHLLRDSEGRGSNYAEDGGIELRAQVTRLATEAYRRGEISAGRLRDLSQKLQIQADNLLVFAESARGE